MIWVLGFFNQMCLYLIRIWNDNEGQSFSSVFTIFFSGKRTVLACIYRYGKTILLSVGLGNTIHIIYCGNLGT